MLFIKTRFEYNSREQLFLCSANCHLLKYFVRAIQSEPYFLPQNNKNQIIGFHE